MSPFGAKGKGGHNDRKNPVPRGRFPFLLYTYTYLYIEIIYIEKREKKVEKGGHKNGKRGREKGFFQEFAERRSVCCGTVDK